MKIISWNVNGIRAIAKKGFLDYLLTQSPDVLCLQETKAKESQVPQEILQARGYRSLWCSAARPGYSGVAVFMKDTEVPHQFGLGVPRFDEEGRTLLIDFPQFRLYNIYFPNGQKDENRLQYKMDFYEKMLEISQNLRKEKRNLVVCGDYNTAHKEIDLTHPKANAKTSGFLPIERAWMDRWVDSGMVDTFRHYCKEPRQYSWWSYRAGARAKNVGWRIDYHFVNREFLPRVKHCSLQQDIMGSDHCPVVLELDL